MTKKCLLLFVSILAVSAAFSFSAIAIKAQTQQFVLPTQLYRFLVSNTNQGYFLTPFYSEGINKGYTFSGVAGFIFVPQVNWIPNNTGMKAVYQWRVNQNGRIYYYYSQNRRTLGSDYAYERILGYMYDPVQYQVTVQTLPGTTQTFSTYLTKSCYSQTYGYWHGLATPVNVTVMPPIYSLEQVPAGNYNCSAEHEVVGTGIFTTRGTSANASPQVSESSPGAEFAPEDPNTPKELFNAPTPPPTCNLTQANACAHNGGSWNFETCTCEY